MCTSAHNFLGIGRGVWFEVRIYILKYIAQLYPKSTSTWVKIFVLAALSLINVQLKVKNEFQPHFFLLFWILAAL